jgi:hypothetical protein
MRPIRLAPGAQSEPSGFLSLISVALPAVLRRLSKQLGLEREDVVQHAIDAPSLEAMVGDDSGMLQVTPQ